MGRVPWFWCSAGLRLHPCLQLVASNVHGTASAESLSNQLVVGLPDAPTVTEVAPTVGKVALKWTTPESNGFIGTK